MVRYTVLNVVTLAVGLAFLYNGYRLVRRGQEAVVLFFTSSVVGGGLILVAIYPSLFTSLAQVLGVQVPDRAILVFSNLVLFVLVMYLFHQLGKLSESISRLNEEVSLLRTELDERDE